MNPALLRASRRDGESTGKDNRLLRMRSGHLPTEFGNWNGVFLQFSVGQYPIF